MAENEKLNEKYRKACNNQTKNRLNNLINNFVDDDNLDKDYKEKIINMVVELLSLRTQ